MLSSSIPVPKRTVISPVIATIIVAETVRIPGMVVQNDLRSLLSSTEGHLPRRLTAGFVVAKNSNALSLRFTPSQVKATGRNSESKRPAVSVKEGRTRRRPGMPHKVRLIT